MAYLDYPGLSYFKSLLDETYLRTSYTGDTTIAGDVTFTGDTVFSKDITGNVDGKAKKDWRGQQIDSTYIKSISTNDNVGQIVYTKGDDTSNYIMIDMMQGATASAAGKAGLVPAPTISERTKFLRGDGEWGVPTDIYVTQNLINTNDSFPILIGATAGATESQVGTAIAFGTKVSVNPNTHALIADHLILKHPTYRRSNNVSSKVMYTLNFADSDDGNGNNLSEIYGYIDKPSEGGEHELGFRLFGNPNVQGVEEIFTYLSVGLSKTNIPYGHAPSTPLPADHNEGTDIITRDWLARNGSETGLVHTSMNETIDGTKTFVKKITANDGMNATGNIASDTLTVRQDATVGRDLAVTRNETVGGTLTTTGNISTASGNISTTNGTISGKTGSIGTGGLTVAGLSNLNGGASVSGGSGLSVTGNETVSGTLTVTGKITGNGGVDTTTLHATDDVIADDDLTVGDTVTVGGQILKKIGTNTTQEYVNYITNQQETKTTIINNLIDPDQGLKLITKGSGVNARDYIAFKIGNGLAFHAANDSAGSKGQVDVDFNGIPASVRADIVNSMVDPEGAIIPNTTVSQSNTTRYGKLTVDFSKLPPAQIESIVSSMVDPDGAIIANTKVPQSDDSYGKLTVDFSKIDQETKDNIISALDMQVPIRHNYTFYVNQQTGSANNANTSSVKVTEVLKSPSTHKFDTIQRCVTWVTTNLAVGSFSITIIVEGNTDSNNKVIPTIYREHVVLPTFTHSTGNIILVGEYTNYSNSRVYKDFENDTETKKKLITIHSVVRQSDGMSLYPIGAEGADWHIRYFTLYYEPHETTSKGLVGGCIGVSDNGLVYLYDCSYIVKYPRVANTDTIDFYYSGYNSEATLPEGRYRSEGFGVRMIAADIGGRIHFIPSTVLTERSEIYCESMQNNGTYVLYCTRSSSITYHHTYSTDFCNLKTTSNSKDLLTSISAPVDGSNNPLPIVDRRPVYCSGSCDAFLSCSSNSSVVGYGGGFGLVFIDKDRTHPMQCKPFRVTQGSAIGFFDSIMYPGSFEPYPTDSENPEITVIPDFDDVFWENKNGIGRSTFSYIYGNVDIAASLVNNVDTYYNFINDNANSAYYVKPSYTRPE